MVTCALARAHGPEALLRPVELMRIRDEAVAVRAAQAVLEPTHVGGRDIQGGRA
jgi:hypothetical protein